MFEQYDCKCANCGKLLTEPDDNPVYVVRLDEYFCDDYCFDTWRLLQSEEVNDV